MPRNDTYTFTVTFERSLSEDLAVLNDENDNPLSPRIRKLLVKLFQSELQAAYDHPNVAPAGLFKINTITIDTLSYPTGETQ